jgi:hypothetical protein
VPVLLPLLLVLVLLPLLLMLVLLPVADELDEEVSLEEE